MNLAECFTKSNVIAELEATDKESAIREMVKQLASTRSLAKGQVAAVEKAILRREELGSTGIGKGVGIPHAKVAGVEGTCGCFARSTRGITFDALDGMPVYIIFMLVSSPDAVEPHLETLRRITALLKNADICLFLRRAKSQSEVADLLREADESLKV